MTKGKDVKKEVKKAPTKTLKEKRLEKKEKEGEEIKQILSSAALRTESAFQQITTYYYNEGFQIVTICRFFRLLN